MRDKLWGWLVYMLFLLSLCIFLCFFVFTPVSSSCEISEETVTPVEEVSEGLDLELVIASSDVDKQALEPITYEDFFRQNGNFVGTCTITHYCAEMRPHICGTGDGITATGNPVIPYWTCAVDPDVIPLGSEVMIDYGDRVEFWKAQDVGSSIKGKRVDVAVWTHEDALNLGVASATVYWMEDKHGES